MLRLSSWETPATHYPRQQIGSAALKNHNYQKGTYAAYMTGPGQERHEHYRLQQRITITNLEIDGETWMVDDPPHWWAMQEHARHYKGRILIAGLGLGLILHCLSEQKGIRRITVVERNPDVIEMISPHVPQKHLEIVNKDWYDYKPRFKPDGVFFDLFVGDGPSLYFLAIREMISIYRRFPSSKQNRIHGFCNESLQAIGEANKKLNEYHKEGKIASI